MRTQRVLTAILVLIVIGVAIGVGYFRPSTDAVPQDETAGNETLHDPLPEAEREFLWQAEHLGLILTQYGWNPTLQVLTGKVNDPAAAEDSSADNQDGLSNQVGAAAAPPTAGEAEPDSDPSEADDLAASKPVSAASATDDPGWFLAADFVGRWDAVPTNVSTNTETLTALVTDRPTESDDHAATETLSASQFLTRLQERIERFKGDVRPHFKLLAVHPVKRNQPDGLWFGRGRITLRGDAPGGHPMVCQLIITYETVRPGKQVLESGGWLKSCQVLRERIVRAEEWLLTDVTADVGLKTEQLHDNWKHTPRTVNTGGTFLSDYNRDGCPDLLVTDVRHFNGVILYEGSPDGRFTDVTIDRGLPRLPGMIDAAWADLDNDGFDDLVFPGVGIFRNEQGTRFRLLQNQTNLVPLILSEGGDEGLRSITGIVVNDYDRDGRLDLYVTRGDAVGFKNGSWIDGKSGQFTSNQLLRNVGDFRFEDVTDETNAGGGNRSVFTAVWLDANLDGWPDVYVINEFGAGLLLVSEEGKRFREIALADESSDFASMGLSCGDFNNDGLTDLYVSNMFSSAGNRVMDNLPPGFYDRDITFKLRRMVSGNQLHLNNGDLTFSGVGPEMDVAEVGWGWGPAVADLNNDGWQDIYATCGFMSHTRANPDG